MSEEIPKTKGLGKVAGFTLKAVADDIAFWFKRDKQIERCAVVGSKKWEEMAVKFSVVSSHGEIPCFAASEADAAWEWLES